MSLSTDKDNNFGLLRLILAFAVIVSHSPQLITGDYSQEPAKQLWGTVSLGGMAVDGFFLVSGYLICMSYQNTGNLLAYLGKRILRIYPGFIVAFAFCVFLVAPFVGGEMPSLVQSAKQAAGMLLLAPPEIPGSFEGMHYPALNGSMWTISYEFRAYLMVALLGVLGLLGKPMLVLAIAVAFIAVNVSGLLPDVNIPPGLVFGGLENNVRLLSFFLAGMCFYLFRDRVVYNGYAALAALLALSLCLFSPWLAEPALAILGGYLVFWFAFKAPLRPISRLLRDDISYGVYLYAWPIQSLVIYWGWTNQHIEVSVIAAVASAILGYISWKLVEQPALRLKTPAPAAQAAA
jgi:peptidoglycan/LPS O-acetylase OafA/YrhL